jgi:hypothetical protein
MCASEVALADRMQKQGKEPEKILAKLRADRAKKGQTGPSQSSVYRFLGGSTYKRDAEEMRGRPAVRPANVVKVAYAERKKLIRKADKEHLVTWDDVQKATKKRLRATGALDKASDMPGSDWLARIVREETDVRARPGKRRITHTKAHEEMRHALALEWSEYPGSWWVNDIHGYIDNKKFVRANTAPAKKLLRATKVHHHLRTPEEGTDKGFVLPKKSRMLLGVPSVDITACVTKDGIIFWHGNKAPWNGEKAAQMYKKLGAALRKHYGAKRKFRIVEDGDPKGFQSSKGVKAKKEQKIESWKLSPHTPSLMPLDFSLWAEIERRTLAKTAHENESIAAYKKRLSITAKRLPKTLVRKCLLKMKDNIAQIVANEGSHTKLD